MNDRDFLAAFEAGTLPEEQFHHPDHVRAAWLLLREEAPAAALARFSSALKRFAAAKGKTRLYHETITWAYLLLIHERMNGEASFDEFRDANPELFQWKPSVLESYYRAETLGSDRAKRTFVMPDRRVTS